MNSSASPIIEGSLVKEKKSVGETGLKNIHLTISYDGTNFCGWQRQDKAAAGRPVRTVQGELEKALEKLAKEPVALIGSGRTDSGVHAYGQAANFFSPIASMEAEKYIPALNSLLPKDIRVRAARQVEQDFHSRFSAISRTYRYFLYPETTPPAHLMAYTWPLRRRPNLRVLNQWRPIFKERLTVPPLLPQETRVLPSSAILNLRFFIQKEASLFLKLQPMPFFGKWFVPSLAL